MSKYGRRTDANHSAIRDGLRGLGWDVLDLSDLGGGVPDLCVRAKDHGIPRFLEVKDGDKPPSQRRLTKEQELWRKYCAEITDTVTSLEEAVAALEGSK